MQKFTNSLKIKVKIQGFALNFIFAVRILDIFATATPCNPLGRYAQYDKNLGFLWIAAILLRKISQ